MKENKESTQVRNSKIDQIFTLVKDKEEKVHICIGNKAVSNKKFDTFEQADRYIGSKPYELICNISYIITIQILEQNEKNKENVAENTKDASNN